MRVVLPREADAAVELDVLLRAHHERGERLRGGDGGGELELGRARLGARRVPRGRGGELGGDEHVGGLVLHRLEHGDDAAELLAHLGVLAGHGDARLRAAGGLGRGEHATEHDRGGARAGEHAVGRGRTVEGDGADAARGVGVRRAPSTVTSSRVASTRSSPSGRRKRSASPAPSTRWVRSSSPTAARTEPSASPGSSSACWASVPHAAMTADAHTVGRNGPGRDHRAHGLDHEHQLGEPEPGAAVGLGQVEPEPAEVGHLLPRRRERLLGGVEQRAGLGERAGVREEGLGDVAQLEVVVGDRDAHGSSPFGVTVGARVNLGAHRAPWNRAAARACAARTRRTNVCSSSRELGAYARPESGPAVEQPAVVGEAHRAVDVGARHRVGAVDARLQQILLGQPARLVGERLAVDAARRRGRRALRPSPSRPRGTGGGTARSPAGRSTPPRRRPRRGTRPSPRRRTRT